jgi:hypothetical protein
MNIRPISPEGELYAIWMALKTCPAIGAEKDEPEGSRYIVLSDTLRIKIVKDIEEILNRGVD